MIDITRCLQILGLSPGASEEEIREAYQKLSLSLRRLPAVPESGNAVKLRMRDIDRAYMFLLSVLRHEEENREQLLPKQVVANQQSDVNQQQILSEEIIPQRDFELEESLQQAQEKAIHLAMGDSDAGSDAEDSTQESVQESIIKSSALTIEDTTPISLASDPASREFKALRWFVTLFLFVIWAGLSLIIPTTRALLNVENTALLADELQLKQRYKVFCESWNQYQTEKAQVLQRVLGRQATTVEVDKWGPPYLLPIPANGQGTASSSQQP